MHGGGPTVVPGGLCRRNTRRRTSRFLKKALQMTTHRCDPKSGSTRWSASMRSTRHEERESPWPEYAEQAGAPLAPFPSTGSKAGDGGARIAMSLWDACKDTIKLKFLSAECALRQRLAAVWQKRYTCDGVSWTPEGRGQKQNGLRAICIEGFHTMMGEDHLSLSADPTRKGVPTGWILPGRDVWFLPARNSSAR